MDTGNLADNGDCSDFPATGEHRSSLIFLGTGCSSAVPNAMCLIQPSNPPCKVCFQALSVPPERNPNYRWFPRYKIPRVDSILQIIEEGLEKWRHESTARTLQNIFR